jgi:hypothetical protein
VGDAGNNVYVTGRTPYGFPIKGASCQPVFGGGDLDVFVAKLDCSLGGDDALIYSTYLGGRGRDEGLALAVDDMDNVYITGYTNVAPDSWNNFPVTEGRACQEEYGGGYHDAFVAKLNCAIPGSNGLLYSTYLGGDCDERAEDIAVDNRGDAYVTGTAHRLPDCVDYLFQVDGEPPTDALYIMGDAPYLGRYVAFVAKLDCSESGESSLIYSTVLGGSGTDKGHSIAVDDRRNAWVAGFTDSPNFPKTWDAITPAGDDDANAFVTRLRYCPEFSPGTRLWCIFSTLLGGEESDSACGIAADDDNNAYVTGRTLSNYFPRLHELREDVDPFEPPDPPDPPEGFDAFVSKLGPRPKSVRIEDTAVLAGSHAFLSVEQFNWFIQPRPFEPFGWWEIGGFCYSIAYDASALTVIEVTPGEFLIDCGWEYFTYRLGSGGNCGASCPSGLVRIVAIADLNNGPNHPTCFRPADTEPKELARMKFLVTNDWSLSCQYIPVRFFWQECGDNAESNRMGDTLWISNDVYTPEDSVLTGEPYYGGHWWLGDCQSPDSTKPSAVPSIDFINGGIYIICPDSIDVRGDLNLNGIANEIGDAVLYTNYFLYGIGVFDVAMEGQIAASDVNNDGLTLSVGDLVYLTRIITGDALPFPKLAPFTQSATIALSVDRSAVVVSTNAQTEIGAGYFVFESTGYQQGEPYLLNGASGMTLKYHEEEGMLKVLVYSMEKGKKIAAGNENIFVIPVTGDGSIRLSENQLSDYNGNMLTSSISKESTLPEAFALQQNYPNPFNAATQIVYQLPKSAHVTVAVFNVLGQKVATLLDRDEPAGVHSVEWNATDESGSAVASGVYFYRLVSENFADEKKMLLLR